MWRCSIGQLWFILLDHVAIREAERYSGHHTQNGWKWICKLNRHTHVKMTPEPHILQHIKTATCIGVCFIHVMSVGDLECAQQEHWNTADATTNYHLGCNGFPDCSVAFLCFQRRFRVPTFPICCFAEGRNKTEDLLVAWWSWDSSGSYLARGKQMRSVFHGKKKW